MLFRSPQSAYKIKLFAGQTLPLRYTDFVYANWLNSCRQGNDYFKLIDSRVYYTKYKPYIKSVLDRDKTLVKIAVLSEDEDVVLGFAIDEGQILHYVYVGKDYRRASIGESLVSHFSSFTHLTKVGMSIWNKKYPDAIFNPFQ